MNPIEQAKLLVAQYFNKKVEKTDHFAIETEDVYIVWFAYVLGGWKALVSTTVNDGMYYEVTYDKVNSCTYLDAYKKWENLRIPDGEVLHKFTN